MHNGKSKKTAKFSAFAVWWDCELIPGTAFSTSPFEKQTHWDQIFLPLSKSLNLKKALFSIYPLNPIRDVKLGFV